MAKKKGGKSNTSNSNSTNASIDASNGKLVPSAEETEVPDVPAMADASPANTAPTPSDSGDLVQQLQQELAAAQAEIAQLRDQVKSKETEIVRLRGSNSTGGAVGGLPKSEDFQKLQERLSQLKKDQAEADAAREAAWRQLKNVVSDISKLVPDASSKHTAMVSPTGGN